MKEKVIDALCAGATILLLLGIVSVVLAIIGAACWLLSAVATAAGLPRWMPLVVVIVIALALYGKGEK